MTEDQEIQLRLEALKQAIERSDFEDTTDDVLNRATKFYSFIRLGVTK